MKREGLAAALPILAVVALAAVSLHAQNPREVSFPSGSDIGHGLLYEPSGPGPHPGLIVIHEWWGLND